MHSRLLGTIAALMVSTISWGQQTEFRAQFSREVQTVEGQPSDLRVLYVDQHRIYVLKSKLRGESRVEVPWILESYDQKTFALNKSVYLKVKEDGKKASMESVIDLNGELHLIYSNNRNGSTRLSAVKLDRLSLELGKERKVICEIPHQDLVKIRDSRFQIELSKDRSKILCFRELSTNRDNRNLYTFVMFDSTFRILWQKEFVLPYGPGRFSPVCVQVGNDGNAYVLGSILSGIQSKSDGMYSWSRNAGVSPAQGTNRVYDLILIQNNGESLTRYPQRMPSGFVTSMRIELHGDELYCSGFYSHGGGFKACGVYFSKVDLKAREVKMHCHSEFDAKFILQSLCKYDMLWAMAREDQGRAAELYNFKVDNLIVEKDGSAILLAEQSYEYSNPNPDYRLGGSGSSTWRRGVFFYSVPRNYHGNILAIKVDPSGQIQWTQRISKAQDTNEQNGVFASYLAANIGGKLYLLFNEDPRNLKDSRQREFSGVHSMVAVVRIDNDGNQSRYFIQESADKTAFVRPRMSGQTSNDEVILFGRKGNKEQFTRVQFE
jgi:hypothetical protein